MKAKSPLDYDSVDLIVRHFPLAQIDSHLKATLSLEDEVPADCKDWWQRKITDLTMAQEIATYCFENNIPTNDIKPQTRDRERGLFALDKVRELEGMVNQLNREMASLQKLADYLNKQIKIAGNTPKVEPF